MCLYIIYIQRGVEGARWACGYRNIQMICLALTQVDEYKRLLFNGTGDIPDVHGIQAWYVYIKALFNLTSHAVTS